MEIIIKELILSLKNKEKMKCMIFIYFFRKAVCGACNTWQLIPRNSSKFICYSCRTICKCVPKNETKK